MGGPAGLAGMATAPHPSTPPSSLTAQWNWMNPAAMKDPGGWTGITHSSLPTRPPDPVFPNPYAMPTANVPGPGVDPNAPAPGLGRGFPGGDPFTGGAAINPGIAGAEVQKAPPWYQTVPLGAILQSILGAV